MTAQKPSYRDWVWFLKEINHVEPVLSRFEIWAWAFFMWALSGLVDQNELNIEVAKQMKDLKSGVRQTPTGRVLSIVRLPEGRTRDPGDK